MSTCLEFESPAEDNGSTNFSWIDKEKRDKFNGHRTHWKKEKLSETPNKLLNASDRMNDKKPHKET